MYGVIIRTGIEKYYCIVPVPLEPSNPWPHVANRHLHKRAVVIVTSFSLWRFASTALAAPVLIMTSFSL